MCDIGPRSSGRRRHRREQTPTDRRAGTTRAHSPAGRRSAPASGAGALVEPGARGGAGGAQPAEAGDWPDTADTGDAGDTAETGEAGDIADTGEAGEPADTTGAGAAGAVAGAGGVAADAGDAGDAADTGEAGDGADTGEAGDGADTGDAGAVGDGAEFADVGVIGVAAEDADGVAGEVAETLDGTSTGDSPALSSIRVIPETPASSPLRSVISMPFALATAPPASRPIPSTEAAPTAVHFFLASMIMMLLVFVVGGSREPDYSHARVPP